MINNLPQSMLTKLVVDDCPVDGLNGMCWVWTGCLNSKGYGCVQINNKRYLVHRVSYQLHVGPIPEQMQIDHLCRRRDCFNPHHLEVVSAAENVHRALEFKYARELERDENRSDELLAEWFDHLAVAQ